MKLATLQYVPETVLPTAFTLYRVQRARARPGTVTLGALKLAPPGTLAGRFDLADQAAGYFAETPETAIYEALARREAVSLSLSVLSQRQLLAVQTLRSLQLADLRPHASSWPVLQSMRFAVTRQLAADASGLGYEGLLYKSAQQYGQDCMVLFGPALGAVRLAWRQALVDTSGGLHRTVATALAGSQIPLVP